MKTFFFLFAIVFLSLATQAFAQTKATLDLFKGIEKNNINLVNAALRAGGDPDGGNRGSVSSTNTAFLKAVSMDRLAIVKLLLDNGANIDQKMPPNLYNSHYTGLMIAVKDQQTAMVKLLLSRGADVNAESLLGRTALHIGAFNNSVEEVKLLLTRPDINVNARPSLCALFVAARQNHYAIVRMLKKQSGSKAVAGPCVEKAIEVAEKNNSAESLSILNQ